MVILSIETSCDETAIAILKFENNKISILTNLVASQIKIHQQYGGIVPMIAKREHIKNLPILLAKANPDWNMIDYIAVTIGPGLDPCLWQGINFARNLAKQYNKKIIGINHLEGHIYANLINKPNYNKFPAICLIVSGGHTELILMQGNLKYKMLGCTRDDAAGEAFDKVARLLGLGFPGGPEIAKQAKQAKHIANKSINLPRPMINQKNYDFSFSGLKTAVLYELKKQKLLHSSKIPQQYVNEMCNEFQQAVIDVLIAKTKKAIQEFQPKSVLFGGGVMANQSLRNAIKNSIQIPYYIPKQEFCTDNAVMIARVALEYANKKQFAKIQTLKSVPNLDLG